MKVQTVCILARRSEEQRTYGGAPDSHFLSCTTTSRLPSSFLTTNGARYSSCYLSDIGRSSFGEESRRRSSLTMQFTIAYPSYPFANSRVVATSACDDFTQ